MDDDVASTIHQALGGGGGGKGEGEGRGAGAGAGSGSDSETNSDDNDDDESASDDDEDGNQWLLHVVGRCRLTLSNPRWKRLGTKRLKLNYDKLHSNLLQICFQIQVAPLQRGVHRHGPHLRRRALLHHLLHHRHHGRTRHVKYCPAHIRYSRPRHVIDTRLQPSFIESNGIL